MPPNNAAVGRYRLHWVWPFAVATDQQPKISYPSSSVHITTIIVIIQNTDKLNEVRATVDLLESQKSEEKTRIIENKLSTAEQNREKELQKKLETLRKHVGFSVFLFFICFSLIYVETSSKKTAGLFIVCDASK